MAKRFTDTNKWRKPFIRGLQGAYKLFWFYILDDCDHAGIWIVDMEVAQIRIGEEITQPQAMKLFGDKIVIFDNGERWWIPDFVEFQYGPVLSDTNRAHTSVINTLVKHNLLNRDKGHVSPLQGVKDKDKDKDKEKDKDKKKEAGPCLMKNSGVSCGMVAIAFGKTDDLKNADPKYYYDIALDWSANGHMKKDWLATIRGFARRDIKDGKLKVSTHKQSGGTNISKDPLPDDYGTIRPGTMTREEFKKSISKIGKI